MHHFEEVKDYEGEVLHSRACRRSKLRGDEIRPTGTANAFDVVLTGDHGLSRYGILEMTNKIKIFGVCMGKWSKCGVSIEILAVYAKIFISEKNSTT